MRYLKGINESEKSLVNIIEAAILDVSSTFVDFVDDSNFRQIIGGIQWDNNAQFDRVKKSLYYVKPENDGYVILTCDIKLHTPTYGYLKGDSLGKLEDVIICMKRLESMGYECLLNLNGSHHQYKPCSVLITIKTK